MSMKVIIADDHTLTREGLKLALSADSEITVTGEAEDGRALISHPALKEADLVILDVIMPWMDGPGLARALKKEYPGLKILAFSGSDDPWLIRKMLEAGARSYVLKTCAPGELLKAVRETMAGGHYFSREVMNNLILDYTGQLVTQDDNLSDKEKRVITLLSDGLNTKQIASEMQLSTKSIEVYRANIMEKLGISSISELVKYALRNGLSRI